MKMTGSRPETHMPSRWSTPADSITLKTDEIHLWRIPLELPLPQVSEPGNILSQEERERAGRYYFQRDRDAFVKSRAALRLILGAYLGQAPHELSILNGIHGKPRLARQHEGELITFNTSRSAGLALLAFSLNRELGIDLECMTPSPGSDDLHDMAQLVFSRQEIAAMHSLRDDALQKAFYTCWTIKEALLKARGVGFTPATGRRDITAAGMPPLCFDNDGNGAGEVSWSVMDIDAGPGYKAALAVSGSDWQLKRWQWNTTL